jgi:protein involved in temperature-dependent protein secretion
MDNTQAGNLFREGRLAEAIAAADDAVKQQPGNAAAGVLLAEFLLFAGDFERADAVLTAAATVDPGAVLWSRNSASCCARRWRVGNSRGTEEYRSSSAGQHPRRAICCGRSAA